jgi:hypothetical protein
VAAVSRDFTGLELLKTRDLIAADDNNAGPPMGKSSTSLLEALISRRPQPEPLRRTDFKGERRRFSVRLPKKTIIDLEIIKLATGEDKNAFVESHLNDAIQLKLKEIRGKHGNEAWEFILASAASRAR